MEGLGHHLSNWTPSSRNIWGGQGNSESHRRELQGSKTRLSMLLFGVYLFAVRGNKRPLSKDELGGKDTELLSSFCIQGVSGFLYLADDSPLSTLVTASQLCSRRLAAGDVRG